MNTNEKPKGIWNPVWPGRRVALLRLLLITSVLFPLFWAINALLVGSWNLLGNRDAESVRQLVEWTVWRVAAVGVIFLASLLPVFGWLFRPRIARRLLIVLVWLVTIVVLFYAEEDWRGARAWNKYRRELEAGGAQLDVAKFIPKPIPDDQNFAAIPLINEWFTQRTNVARWEDNYSRAWQQVSDSVFENKDDRRFTDLVAWQQAFDATRSGKVDPAKKFESGKLDTASRVAAVAGVLRGLSDDESDLAELRAASKRPAARYPIFYDLENPWGILLPHLGRIKQSCRRLQLKACAELAAGRSDDALNDVKLMLYLADSVKDETFLISYLVRISCVQLATQPVWEGLAEHRWSDAQLQELQKRFQRYDFVADMKQPFDSERAAVTLTADIIRKKGGGFLIEIIGPGAPTSMDKKFANVCSGLAPRGWYYLEQMNYLRLCKMQLDGAFDPTNKRISPGRIEANNRDVEREMSTGRVHKLAEGVLHHRLLAAVMKPALNKIPGKGAMAQTAADQAMLACALERFRLAHGNYPETLAALEPTFIPQMPRDVITGMPFIYRRANDGRFTLYSVGWDEKDDGGVSGKTLFDEKQGDWVW